MASDLLYEDPESAWQRAASNRRQRFRRNVTFYLTAYVAGLVLLLVLGTRGLGGDQVQWALLALALVLWSFFAVWSLRDARSAARRLSRRTLLTRDSLVLTGVPDPIPVREITQVFWNPDLPYFVILRGELTRTSPFVVARKTDLADPNAVRSALKEVVSVVDSPAMDLKSIAAQISRAGDPRRTT